MPTKLEERLAEAADHDGPRGMPLNAWRDEAHRIAKEHGFTDATIGEDIALMHSELSEALEDHRSGKAPNEVWYEVTYEKRNHPLTNTTRMFAASMSSSEVAALIASKDVSSVRAKPCGIPSELADVIIRVLHFAGKHGIDIEKAVTEKMLFNESRPMKHGGKKL